MKKIFALAIAMMMTFASGLFAQQTEHFQFKGIPIDGTLANFGKSLVEEGFVKVADNVYKGKFLRTEAIVALVGDDNNMIWRVATIMPSTDTWSILESSFNSYVDLYKEKYGKPTKHTKDFTGYTSDNSGLKMIAVGEGECNYVALWDLPQGSIEVKIVKGSKYNEGTIRIVYTDGMNKDEVRKSDLNEI